MPGDFSRSLFDPTKHYSAVLAQQGRVQEDASWNAAVDIARHRTVTEATDVVGACGVPKAVDGFALSLTPDGADIVIAPGRIYVDGLLCELESGSVPAALDADQDTALAPETFHLDGAPLRPGDWVEVAAAQAPGTEVARIVALDEAAGTMTLSRSLAALHNAGAVAVRRVLTYTTQPDLPAPEFTSAAGSPPSSPPDATRQLTPPDGHYIAYLDVWERQITALDDPRIREVALGGPDTTLRRKTVWQLKLLPVAAGGGSPPPACDDDFPEWRRVTAAPGGRMNARTTTPPDNADPCQLPPTAGYRRLENQLYRVEIQRGGTFSAQGGAGSPPTFKWSRENAAVETRILKIDGGVALVEEVGKDDVLGFTGDQWAEIADEESELRGTPRDLVQIERVDPATRKITMKTPIASLAGRKGLKLRRWDQSGAAAQAAGVAMATGWIALEDGVEVRFEDGDYRSGDYWLIPARTATGEIEWPPFRVPNPDPIPQPPVGIGHHHCRLALLTVGGGTIQIADCRRPFAPLTELSAEDIGFDNRICNFPVETKTVQDALDRLCRQRDIRFHNKHLHGWGIVCGLQVECGPAQSPAGPRRLVTVRRGYAIDCEGNDIVLERDQRVDVFELIAESVQSPPVAPGGPIAEAEVCLVLDGVAVDGSGRFRLERYDPARNTWGAAFSGTLLMDFLNGCIQPLVDFVKDQLTPDDQPAGNGRPVGPGHRRATALTNLGVQLVNRDNGGFVFLSGDAQSPPPESEHVIIRDIYFKLRALLASKTFCAMFENARPFPDYPFRDTGIVTVYGKGFHTRLRVSPDGSRGYTVGGTSQIFVYDLVAGEMAAELTFPGGESARVQDVAVSADGRRVYAIAAVDQDTMFAAGDVDGFAVRWSAPSVICDIELVALATRRSAANTVYAIGRGRGLYEINPSNVEKRPEPRYAFDAVGHLVIDEARGDAYATARTEGSDAPSGSYDMVLRLDLDAQAANPPRYIVTENQRAVTGQDDIAVTVGPERSKVYVVLGPAVGRSGRRIAVFDANAPERPRTVVDADEDTAIRLAHNPATDHMMVSYEDSYRVGLLDSQDRPVPGFRHPVQVSPIAIVAAPANGRVYVLNAASNSISAVPIDRFQPARQLDLEALVAYRAAILEAFADLVGGLVQYLKDCLCDHFLVNCPTCTPDDKIYLACISLRNDQVFKVCNFSQRRYVKSFPTVEYWLSLVPVIPLIGKAVAEVCCAVLPDLFGRYSAPRPSPQAGIAANTLTGSTIRGAVDLARTTDFRAVASDTLRLDRLGALGGFGADWVRARGGRPGPAVTVHEDEIVDQPIEDARRRLERANVTVERIEAYDPIRGPANIARFYRAPRRLAPGSRVVLVERDGKVSYYAPVERAPDFAERLRGEIDETRAAVGLNRAMVEEALKLKQEVAVLRVELENQQRANADALARRDREIAELTGAVRAAGERVRETEERFRAAEAKLADVDRLSAIIAELNRRIPPGPER